MKEHKQKDMPRSFFNIKIIIRSHIKQEMDKVVQVKKEA